MAREEMIGALKQREFFGISGGRNNLRQLLGGRKLVAISADEELGEREVLQRWIFVVAIAVADRESKSNQRTNAGCQALAAVSSDRHGCAEAEARENDGAIVLLVKPVESREHIAGFGFSIVNAAAQADAAKIEAQDRTVETPMRCVEDLHGVVDDLVVKVAAAERMRMADQRGKGSAGSAFIHHRLQTAC